MSFLPPPAIRKVIAVPTQDKIDFRAACFCHKNIVDIGFVCSVCLSSQLPAPPTIPYIVNDACPFQSSVNRCLFAPRVCKPLSHCPQTPLTENVEQNSL